MKVSLEWLKSFVDIDCSVDELVDKLTMSGTKVEGYEKRLENIKNVVVGKILEISLHPHNQNLFVCKVDTKDKILTIITAAKNVKVDSYVPVAKPGAVLANGKTIDVLEFKGIVSEGMLCSLEELGLTRGEFSYADENGIFILEGMDDSMIGTDIKIALGIDDVIIDFEITSNRPDCLSIVGIAREIAAILNKPLKFPNLNFKEADEPVKNYIDGIEIQDKKICRRYMGRVIKNVKIGQSPLWLRRRLVACGVRPINNIVDVTNYVMLEMGQPLHAFDLNKICGRNVFVRLANDSERIVTLDGAERVLRSSDIVIADEKRAIAVAGVMGGLDTEVDENTTLVLLESATFNPAMVRRTARYLGLRTEASNRFEKGLSPYFAELAIQRACALIEQIGAGEVVKGAVDTYVDPWQQVEVKADFSYIEKLLGLRIEKGEVVNILNRLEIKYDEEKEVFIIPPFRTDIEDMADISEEVIRIYGYDKLPSRVFMGNAISSGLTQKQKMVNNIKNFLANSGYYEIYSYSFESPKVYEVLKGYNLDDAVKISNPLGEDFSIMRMQLLSSILKTIYLNISRNIKDVKVFELSTVFKKSDEKLPQEKLVLAIGSSAQDFYSLKGVLENLFDMLRIKDVKFSSQHQNPNLHPTRSAKIYTDESFLIGYIGEVHPDILERFDIPARVVYAEVYIDKLLEAEKKEKRYAPLPKYPAVERDYAFVVPDDVESRVIEVIFKKYSSDILEEFRLFDVYKGQQIKPGFKSYAYKAVFRSKSKTLSDSDINQIQEKILDELKNYNISLRE
ncbi:phenylalanine--tRNA ligase subunit beta [Caldicellulosiruptor acetigenus]|uniref:Phenylalanine--tRNA ligase beta subunit n=1 Tax=Caldicellulosiruptor acetigenus 6A TaxID=632516 RepID=G2PTD3_9FIRM|nr:phenylalanine--tRNA ligase subunit beta [Caldicellulosiruptor acetigenus]AEM73324.1 Phenylalanyl-tRNA synthetase beta chain [Caldicellulosiruptor acetigenus 6A]